MKRPLIVAFTALLMLTPLCGSAQRLGPVETYADLILLADQAEDGDTVLVCGNVLADETTPLTSNTNLKITSVSDEHAVVSGLHLRDASVSFSNIDLDSLTIDGTSHIILDSNVNVTGRSNTALDFKGNGELIINPSCIIIAGEGGNGISIRHDGGNLYAALEGTIIGGHSSNGGVGLMVSPLQSEGMLLIGGNITGGDGTDIGGNAVNLYDISGNAFITVTGTIKGGNGHIGGDGVQVISPQDTSNIGFLGHIEGGKGNEFGGNALFVLNAADQSTISLSGALIGGNSVSDSSEPGQSLLLVGNGAINHMYSTGCLLEDGQIVTPIRIVADDKPSDTSNDAAVPETPPLRTAVAEITEVAAVPEAAAAPFTAEGPVSEAIPDMMMVLAADPGLAAPPPVAGAMPDTAPDPIIPPPAPASEPAPAPAAEPVPEPAPAPAAEPVPEPASAPAPEQVPDPMSEPDSQNTAKQIENITDQKPETITDVPASDDPTDNEQEAAAPDSSATSEQSEESDEETTEPLPFQAEETDPSEADQT